MADKGRILGIAWLTWEELLCGHGYCGELPLYPPPAGHDRRPSAGTSTGKVPWSTLQGPAGAKVQLPQSACLRVSVQLPKGFLQVLALHERHKLKVRAPAHQSEVTSSHMELQLDLERAVAAEESNGVQHVPVSSEAFCMPCSYNDTCPPPDRIVVHSRHGNFLHMATTVLADALGKEDGYAIVQSRLLERDFHGLLDLLQEEGRQGARYWIDMFAMDLDSGHKELTGGEKCHWHEELITALPSLVRSLHRACCLQMISNLEAKCPLKCGLLCQLGVVDRDFLLLGEHSALAELMIGAKLQTRQRIALHPEHWKGPALRAALANLEMDFKATGKFDDGEGRADNGLPWTVPYLQDGKEVVETVQDLIIRAIHSHQKGDDKSIWYDLNMEDLVLTGGTINLGRDSGHEGHAHSSNNLDMAQDEAGPNDGAVADADD